MEYLFYKIDTVEPVKMSGQNKAEETQGSLDYITGSSVRGAMIGQYERIFKISLSENADVKRKLLKDVFFLNAYPMSADPLTGKAIRTLPAPFCFYTDKKNLDAYEGTAIPIRCGFDKTAVAKPEDERICCAEPFVYFGSDTVYGVKVEKEFKLHVSVNPSKNHGLERAMFRYETILPGQSFCGAVIVKDETMAEKIRKLVSNGIFYLGGSKGSGYGRVRMTLLNDVKEETVLESEWGQGQNEIYIYYVSDALLLDEYGNLTGHLPEKLIETTLGINHVKYEGGIGRTVNITGYNSSWRSAMPQMTGIKAGTLQKYSFDGDTSRLKEKVWLLQEKGIGLRRQEGYGRILILSGGFIQRYWKRDDREEKQNQGGAENLSHTGQAQAQLLLKNLYRQHVMREIDRRVVETARTISRRSVSNAQLGRMLDLFAQAEYSSAGSVKRKVSDYFYKMKKRQNGRPLRQFQDTEINGVSFEQYMLDFMENCDRQDIFTEDREYREFQICRLSEYVYYEPDSREVFRYNMIFIEKLLRYLLRDRKREE